MYNNKDIKYIKSLVPFKERKIINPTTKKEEIIEAPTTWSDTAVTIVASKYLYGGDEIQPKETSIAQLVARVCREITEYGKETIFKGNTERAEEFFQKLCKIIIQQDGSFNSPVWFNVGVKNNYIEKYRTPKSIWEKGPQVSACFILSVEDNLQSIMDLAYNEAFIFKWGSGAGTNNSPIRSMKEGLTGGGTASGPLSFMEVRDTVAKIVKSGGKSRRAAKMEILNIDHPDIEEFVTVKLKEEEKIAALAKAGWSTGIGGEAEKAALYQNSNFSVRVSDAFMEAVEDDDDWELKYVKDGKTYKKVKARELFNKICESALKCGDPGIQFDDTINDWHTCPNSGRITASNPCSEYMFLNDSACNLASINLLNFLIVHQDGTFNFDVKRFTETVETFIIAQDILVDLGSYPTKKIAENSGKYRPLGLGYTNLGALLMRMGIPYDSMEGRVVAGLITSILTGKAYEVSAIKLAAKLGPAEGMEKQPLLNVLNKHRQAIDGLKHKVYYYLDDTRYSVFCKQLLQISQHLWNSAITYAEMYGVRNLQTTVLAPTGTISFMMDCQTTGIEPELSLIKYKQLADQHQTVLTLVNTIFIESLKDLGYDESTIEKIKQHIKTNGTLSGCEYIKHEHKKNFQTALEKDPDYTISPTGHIKMMAAVQPFLSGAISKTVNMPASTTVQDIANIYMDAWSLGLKSIAIYVDKSKNYQPLTTKQDVEPTTTTTTKNISKTVRRRLPTERNSLTHKFSIAGHEGYVTVGFYPDGSPGELFIVMSKSGSTISGLTDAFATAISISLQYGVPLDALIRKFKHTRYEPSGFTSNPDIPTTTSITDYIFKWLEEKFSSPETISALPEDNEETLNVSTSTSEQSENVCTECGSLLVRTGSCYTCTACGTTTGCG